jgi:hypothetical protein
VAVVAAVAVAAVVAAVAAMSQIVMTREVTSRTKNNLCSLYVCPKSVLLV